jgi:hypothetical protein
MPVPVAISAAVAPRFGGHVARDGIDVCSASCAACATPAARARPPGCRGLRRRSTGTRASVDQKLTQRTLQSIPLARKLLVAAQSRLDLAQPLLDGLRHIGQIRHVRSLSTAGDRPPGKPSITDTCR